MDICQDKSYQIKTTRRYQMNKNQQQTLKTVLISSLVSINILVWHNLLGAKFLLAVIIFSLIVTLISKTKND